MAKITLRICEWHKCHKQFHARTADVDRGWAKFCSKKCKAKHQADKFKYLTQINNPLKTEELK
jgi:predicted Zn-dependent protease